MALITITRDIKSGGLFGDDYYILFPQEKLDDGTVVSWDARRLSDSQLADLADSITDELVDDEAEIVDETDEVAPHDPIPQIVGDVPSIEEEADSDESDGSDDEPEVSTDGSNELVPETASVSVGDRHEPTQTPHVDEDYYVRGKRPSRALSPFVAHEVLSELKTFIDPVHAQDFEQGGPTGPTTHLLCLCEAGLADRKKFRLDKERIQWAYWITESGEEYLDEVESEGIVEA